MLIRRAVKVLRPFIALFHNPSRAADAAPGAHRSRKGRYVRYVADSTHARRLICFIACFGLLLSSQPVLPAGRGKSAEKPKARLTQGPPGLNLPNLNEARRMRASAPKIAPPVSATIESNVTPSAPAPLSLQVDNWPMALMDQRNRVGTSREDLLSRNFNWGVPIVGLPGRAGLDLNIGLSLNSLIWTKSGTNMHFNLDKGFPSVGFRLGFPELGAAFTNTETGTSSMLITMPSGLRYEFRENPSLGSNVYEEMGGTHMLLVIKPGTFNYRDTVWTLLPTDGTAYKFKIPTNGNKPKCIEVKDRSGNFISVAYTALDQISAVTETLGRVVSFNYDGSNRLISITQNWAGGTHTYATFAYDNVTIQANFQGLNMVGAANGTVISVLSRVDMADGKVYAFEHNTYAQIRTIRCYAPNSANPVNFPGDYTLLSSISYDLPSDAGGPKSDCPRFLTRIDWAKDWTGDAPTSYDGDGATWGSVTTPDGTVYKEFFGDSGWQRGLTLRTETWSNDSLKKWTTMAWDNDNPNVSYWLNPRMTETNVYDDTGKRRRTKIDYADFGAVSDIFEYDAPLNASTVLRHTQFEYLRGTAYTGNLKRRLTQLVKSQTVKDGSGALYSKITYQYDLGGEYLVNDGPPIRHDTTNFGLSFVQGRGDLNVVRRWDVTAPDDDTKSLASTVGYNTSGSVIFSRDPLGHTTSMIYDDSFSDAINRSTFAYPTTIKDAVLQPSTVQYNFDFGAEVRSQDPKGAAVVNTYDSIGRLERVTNQVNQAYTRYVYAPDHLYIQTFTTVNDLSSEFYQITVFNGHGMARGVAADHPGSAGGYKAQSYEYDNMRRLVRQTNPTEINVNWIPAGDDAGWVWSSQDYDWNGRQMGITNQDGTTRSISYEGCGCAGGHVAVMQDEVGRRQKVYSDVLGRVVKAEDLLSDGSVYRTVTTKYNVRDQVEDVKSIAGSAGAFQIATNEYDGYGRLSKRKLPIEGAASPGTRFTYNKDDTVNTATDPRNVVSTYTYDDRKLVTEVSFNTGGNPDIAGYGPLSFTYDENGNRLTMTDGAGSTTYHYDSLSQLDWEKRYFNDLSQDYYIYYTYNLAGQVKEIKDHFNDVVYYNMDGAGQVASVTGADLTRGEQYQFTSSQPGSRITYRAWGGLKRMTAGNGVKTNMTYDQSMRVRLFEVTDVLREPGYWDQSSLGMKAEHEYYADGMLRYVKDHKDGFFDRAYDWDQVGRLGVAYTGPEARGFAGKEPPTTVSGPYRQAYQHDVWGNMTNRATQFWSKTDNVSVSVTPETGRNQDWSYDAAGNLTQDNNLRYLYDAAGFNWQTQDLSGVPKTTQLRDGDGNVVKNGCFRYANSTVLGGLALTEIDCVGGKNFGNVYLGGTRIAQLRDGTSFTIPPDKWVIWDHVNPVTGSNGRSHENVWYYNEAELDPMGVNVGFDDPFVLPEPPPDPGMESGIPEIIPLDDGPLTGTKCSLDGIVVDCGFVAPLLRSGAAVAVPNNRTTEPLYNKDGRFVGYGFFNSGSGKYDYNQLIVYNKIVAHLADGFGTMVIGEWTDIKKERGSVVHTEVIGAIAGGLEFIGGTGPFQRKKPVQRRRSGGQPSSGQPVGPTASEPPVVSNCPPTWDEALPIYQFLAKEALGTDYKLFPTVMGNQPWRVEPKAGLSEAGTINAFKNVGWTYFFNGNPEHFGGSDYEKYYKGAWYHVTIAYGEKGFYNSGSDKWETMKDKSQPPAWVTLHCEQRFRGSSQQHFQDHMERDRPILWFIMRQIKKGLDKLPRVGGGW